MLLVDVATRLQVPYYSQLSDYNASQSVVKNTQIKFQEIVMVMIIVRNSCYIQFLYTVLVMLRYCQSKYKNNLQLQVTMAGKN